MFGNSCLTTTTYMAKNLRISSYISRGNISHVASDLFQIFIYDEIVSYFFFLLFFINLFCVKLAGPSLYALFGLRKKTCIKILCYKADTFCAEQLIKQYTTSQKGLSTEKNKRRKL
jgi:hypothetical protein